MVGILYFGGLIALVVGVLRLWQRLNPPIADPQYRAGSPGFIYGFRENDGLADRLHLGIGVRDQLRFSLRREHAWDRFAKWIGLAREIQSGDASFDRALYVTGDDPRLIDFLGRDQGFRTEALEMLSIGAVRRIDCFEGTLSVTVACRVATIPKDEDTLLRIDALADPYLPALHRLAARLDAFRSIPWDDAYHPLPRRHARFNAITLVLGATSLLALFFLTFDNHELPRPLDSTNARAVAFVAALTAVIGFATAAWRLLRGSSIAHIAIFELVVLGGSSVFALTLVATSIYNIRADASPATIDIARIQDKTIVRGGRNGGSVEHFLLFDAPSPLLGTARLGVKSWEFRAANLGDCLEIRRYPGALGDPWIAPLRYTECGAAQRAAEPPPNPDQSGPMSGDR